MANKQLWYGTAHPKDAMKHRGAVDTHETCYLRLHLVDKVIVSQVRTFLSTIMDGCSQENCIWRAAAVKFATNPGTGIYHASLLIWNNKAKAI